MILILLVVVIQASLAAETPAEPLRPHPRSHMMDCPGPALTVLERAPEHLQFQAGGTTFTIVPQYDSTVSQAQRRVIQQAITEWNIILRSRGVNPGTWTIPITYMGSNATRLAQAAVSWLEPGGVLASASINIFTNHAWYIDTIPNDDVEFETNPPPGFDLLTVMRHELGHAVGWLGPSGKVNSRTSTLVSNGVFDAARLNIGVVDGGDHADPAAHPGEVMEPSLGQSTRRPIRLYPTAALVSRAYEYAIGMHFVDPAYTGTETGSAWQPWRSLPVATVGSPEVPLLLAPTVHHVPAGQVFATPDRWDAARGGARIVAP